MAVLPNKFNPASGGIEARVAALEEYIKYLEEHLEHHASAVNKKIEEVRKSVN